MSFLKRIFSAGPSSSEDEVFSKLATITGAPPEIVQELQHLPSEKREIRYLDYLEKAGIGAIVDIRDDEDTIVRALRPCFPEPQHTNWSAIASELHDLPEAPAEEVLRVLIRHFREEQLVLRVFASGHDYWTCVFVSRGRVVDFDACIGGSSIVGYEELHKPERAE